MDKTVNHECVVCGKGYYHCNDCNQMRDFTPWRKVACSIECYQAYLAFIEYRRDGDKAKYKELLERSGVDTSTLPADMQLAAVNETPTQESETPVESEAPTHTKSILKPRKK